jgi:hypothetical protein
VFVFVVRNLHYLGLQLTSAISGDAKTREPGVAARSFGRVTYAEGVGSDVWDEGDDAGHELLEGPLVPVFIIAGKSEV